MNYYTPDDIQLMRQLGTFLCFLPILSVLMEMGKSAALCALLFTNAFIWPYAAYRMAFRSRDPTNFERKNLRLDAAFGGCLGCCDGTEFVAFNYYHGGADLRSLLGRRLGPAEVRAVDLSVYLCAGSGQRKGHPWC